ncbi:Cyanovirin-N [Linnemannia elongata]|nr:Cyanovirin-N [Linnemannia elongata]
MRFHAITLLSCLAAASLAVPLQKRCDPSIIVSCKNFALSSDLRTLTATCESNKGSNKESSIVINDFIGNNNGNFVWGSNNFIHSSSNIHLNGVVLHADLEDVFGDPTPSQIDLVLSSARIAKDKEKGGVACVLADV